MSKKQRQWRPSVIETQTLDFADLNARFENEAPCDILRWAWEQFGDDLAVVTSFQPTGLVTLHMLLEFAPDVRVLTLDTGLLFPETVGLVDRWERDYGLNLTRVRPAQTVAEQAAGHGEALWERDPDLCCHLRKTVPLDEALKPFGAWITGLRRDQSDRRRATPIVSLDAKYGIVKLSPLATWTNDMVWTYIHAHGLPYNTLHDQNYASIGCWPCTRAVAPGEDQRAGRWSGRSKTECGIHISPLPMIGAS
jgi:phosphoadenosine phosphosulfate reductase